MLGLASLLTETDYTPFIFVYFIVYVAYISVRRIKTSSYLMRAEVKYTHPPKLFVTY